MIKFLRNSLILAAITTALVWAQAPNITEKKIKTVYDINGRPVQQSESNKGWHRVSGSATLSSGKATISLNTSTANGKQDISFLADTTYFGSAWSTDTTSVYRYRINPLSGTQFMIISDSSNDTSTVQFLVEGQ